MLMLGSSAFGFQNDEETKEPDAVEQTAEEDNSPKAKLEAIREELLQLNRKDRSKLRELQKEFRGERAKMQEAFAEYGLKSEESRNEILKRALEIGAAADEDSKTSLEALSNIMTGATDTELKEHAVDLLVKHHIENEAMLKRIGRYMSGMPSKSNKILLEKMLESSEDEQVKGVAAISLAQHILDLKKLEPRLTEEDSRFAEANPDLAEYVESMSADMELESLKSRFNKIAEEFKDVKLPIGLRSMRAKKGDLIGETAANTFRIYEKKAIALQRTSIGSVAPDISGPDIDGEDFKLSDYRGKVVLLDFWGDW